jgi:hypothetical protein
VSRHKHALPDSASIARVEELIDMNEFVCQPNLAQSESNINQVAKKSKRLTDVCQSEHAESMNPCSGIWSVLPGEFTEAA